MTHEQTQRAAAKSDIDYRLLVPFLLHVVLAQTLILVVRITTSYRVIELGEPVLWLGIIATGFAIVPAFTALSLGRWIDRGNDAKACWIGAALIVFACIAFWAWPLSALHLLAFSVILGFRHMFCMAGYQMLAVRAGGIRNREAVLGYYMVAASVGQGFGPFVIASLAGSAALPPTGMLFGISLICAIVSVMVALLIRPSALRQAQHDPGKFVAIADLLKLRGFAAVMMSSVVTVTATDLLVIYLPALGAERQIDSNHIGFLLTVRSVTSLLSRMVYARDDLCHRSHASDVDQHAWQRSGIPCAGHSALVAAYVLGSRRHGRGDGDCIDPDHFRGGASCAAPCLRHRAYATHDRQSGRPDRIPGACRLSCRRERSRRHSARPWLRAGRVRGGRCHAPACIR